MGARYPHGPGHPSYDASNEADARAKRREAIQMATGARKMLVPLTVRARWKRQKAERLRDADEWIKALRRSSKRK